MEPYPEMGSTMPETITVAEAGRRGGHATAAKLTPEERSESARRAVKARWAKVRAQVAESRMAQGLPATVEDSGVLSDLAREAGGADAR
jgi:hypothetical protein